MKLIGINIILIASCFCIGCNEQAKSISAEAKNDKKQTAANSVNTLSKEDIGNDIKRLHLITDKMNLACRGAYIFVLGVGDSAGGNMITVDYQLFDSLTDDGAAVMIAEKISAKRMQVKEANITERQILQIDEMSGSIIAAAGFNSSGFNHWLEKGSFLSITNQAIPQKSRSDAFMRGYQKK